MVGELKELAEVCANQDIAIKSPLTDSLKVDGRELINRLNISPRQTSLILMSAKLVEELDEIDSFMRGPHKTDA